MNIQLMFIRVEHAVIVTVDNMIIYLMKTITMIMNAAVHVIVVNAIVDLEDVKKFALKKHICRKNKIGSFIICIKK